MKTEQLKPILTRLNGQLIETLAKLEPSIKTDYWAQNPTFKGICFLIEKALPAMNKAGENELNQLAATLKAAKDTFWLQKNETNIATCFVFANVLSKSDQIELEQYFWENVAPIAIKTARTSAKPFSYFLVGANVPGFTSNTLYKLIAKNINNEIQVIEQREPQQTEKPISIIPGNRAKLIEQYKAHSQNPTILKASERISAKFEAFIEQCQKETKTLTEQFNTLENLLQYEIGIRQSSQNGHYLRLQFDELANERVKKILFHALNGKAFQTSENNFYSVFTPEPTTAIRWNWNLNAFLKLFFAFENLEVDGFSRSFSGLLETRKDVFWSIAASFEFKDRPVRPLHEYISGKLKTLENKKPREFSQLWPVIEQLKKVV
jgi:preprotein translocase subunit SecE